MMKEESLLNCLPELTQLAAENGKEIYGDSYAPSITSFIDLATGGLLRVFTVREDGILVGYAMFVVSPKLHQRLLVCADCTTIYLTEAHRGNKARELVKYAEEQLISSGVAQIQYHARPAFKKFFRHLGYEVSDYTYVKDV
jgi:hypothetical protein